ncbi:MAG TPA: lysoplasmalogenase [Cyclobacteriaceae bacterium]|nr:lysoplasmalogenase [Cyclobacteriaceae bacterium]HNT51515.1 lysoplasmalogenase [Cyclobacteriaceae bacterium]
MRKTSLLVFGTLAATNLIAATFNLALLNFITKPLLVPALAVYYLVATSQRSYLFLTALFFCWLGDVLLMLQRDELFFIAGLVAFLTGQVLYIICYRNFRSAGTGLTGPQQIRFSLPIILAGTGLVTILFPHLGGLQIPVLVYALVITVMAMQALFRYGYTNSKSFVLVFVGALSFMISDSLLAINKFMQPLPLAGLAVMLTYLLAQYLIVEGVVRHDKN